MNSERLRLARPGYALAASLLLIGAASAGEDPTSGQLQAEACVRGKLPAPKALTRKVVVLASGALKGSLLPQVAAAQQEVGCEELLVVLNLTSDPEVGEAENCKSAFPGAIAVRGATLQGRAHRRGRVHVFRQGGALAYRGSINAKLTAAIREALLDAEPDLQAGLKTAGVQAVARRAAKRGKLGAAVDALERYLTGDDADAQVDARQLKDRIERLGRRRLTAAEAAPPAERVARLKRLAKAFKGHALGKQAAEKRAALLKDPGFKQELKASKLLGKLRKGLAAVRPCGRCAGGGGFSFDDDDDADPLTAAARTGSGRLRCPGCRQKNRRLVGALAAGFKRLARFNGTQAAANGAALGKPLTAPPTGGGGGGGIGFGP